MTIMYLLSFHEFHLLPLFYNCTYLSDVFIILIKRLSILPVVKCSYSHDVFFLVDNRQGQDVFNDPASFIYRSFLQRIKTLRLFLFLTFCFEIIIDSQLVAKIERSWEGFTQFTLMVTCHITIAQYQSQKQTLVQCAYIVLCHYHMYEFL